MDDVNKSTEQSSRTDQHVAEIIPPKKSEYTSFQVPQCSICFIDTVSIVTVDQTISSNFPPFLQPQPYHHLLRNKIYLLTPGLKG